MPENRDWEIDQLTGELVMTESVDEVKLKLIKQLRQNKDNGDISEKMFKTWKKNIEDGNCEARVVLWVHSNGEKWDTKAFIELKP